MGNLDYVVYYNAVATREGAHLIALGYAHESGFKPKFEYDTEKGNYIFTLEKNSDEPAQVKAPFAVTIELKDDPKSVTVKDDYNIYHVQVNGLIPAKESENEPGRWIESGDITDFYAAESGSVAYATTTVGGLSKPYKIILTQHYTKDYFVWVAEEDTLEDALSINVYSKIIGKLPRKPYDIIKRSQNKMYQCINEESYNEEAVGAVYELKRC